MYDHDEVAHKSHVQQFFKWCVDKHVILILRGQACHTHPEGYTGGPVSYSEPIHQSAIAATSTKLTLSAIVSSHPPSRPHLPSQL